MKRSEAAPEAVEAPAEVPDAPEMESVESTPELPNNAGAAAGTPPLTNQNLFENLPMKSPVTA